MEDNKWYAVDATWDDPLGNDISTVYYNYFLRACGSVNCEYIPFFRFRGG